MDPPLVVVWTHCEVVGHVHARRTERKEKVDDNMEKLCYLLLSRSPDYPTTFAAKIRLHGTHEHRTDHLATTNRDDMPCGKPADSPPCRHIAVSLSLRLARVGSGGVVGFEERQFAWVLLAKFGVAGYIAAVDTASTTKCLDLSSTI